jgi:hypothetical protein
MTFLPWLLVATGWLLALAAYMTARRTSRKLAQLTEMYWELKYDHGELKARVKALAGDESSTGPPSPPVQGFVPIGDVKRRS